MVIMLLLHRIWSRSSMDRMTDSGSVGWAFESPRDHKKAAGGSFFVKTKDKSKKTKEGRREQRDSAFEPSERSE
jgi:hypothetical protein